MNLNTCINYCINLIKMLKLIFFFNWNRGEYDILFPVCWTKRSQTVNPYIDARPQEGNQIACTSQIDLDTR